MDFDFYTDLGISIVVTLLKTKLKSPAKIAQFKAVFLKINKLTQARYGSDPDFKEVWAE